MPRATRGAAAVLAKGGAAGRALRGLEAHSGGDFLLRADLETALSVELDAAAELIARLRDPEMRYALYKHYVQGFTWDATADSLGRSVRYIYYLREQALDLLDHGESGA